MAAGDAPVSLDNYFNYVEFVRPSNNPLTPHVNEKPIELLSSGRRKLKILISDKHQKLPVAIVFLDARTQKPSPISSMQCEVIRSAEVFCSGEAEVPNKSFYIAVSYPTPSGNVLRIHPRLFKPII